MVVVTTDPETRQRERGCRRRRDLSDGKSAGMSEYQVFAPGPKPLASIVVVHGARREASSSGGHGARASGAGPRIYRTV